MLMILPLPRVFMAGKTARAQRKSPRRLTAMTWSHSSTGICMNGRRTIVRRPFMQIPVEEWDQVMAVNLRGLFLCARAVFPAMKTRGKGKIISISSSTFFKGVPNYIHYTTSKGGVVGFTRSLARELGEFGIRVNAIAPGFTLSGENEKNMPDEGKEANIRLRMLKRAEVPEDLVGTLVFLASDDSDFITGQTILVDGGGSVH